jgi:hypothetical protein
MLLFTSASLPMVLRQYTGDWIERRRVRYRGGFCWAVLRATKFSSTQDVIYRRKTWLLPKNTPPRHYKHPRHFAVGVCMYIIHSHWSECPTTILAFFYCETLGSQGGLWKLMCLNFQCDSASPHSGFIAQRRSLGTSAVITSWRIVFCVVN